MANKKQKSEQNEHSARASGQNMGVSTKHCLEICRHLRYKRTAQAKKILEDVIAMKVPIPFKKFNRDMGHKAGIAAGRFPQKAAREVLKLIKSVEANAQNKGLNTANLKIIKLLANKAATPMTGGRQRTGTKRTHVEIEVKETKEKKKEKRDKKTETPDKKKDTKEEKINDKKEISENKVEVKTEVQKDIEPETKVEEKSETVVKEEITEGKKEELKKEPAKKKINKETAVEEQETQIQEKPTGEQTK